MRAQTNTMTKFVKRPDAFDADGENTNYLTVNKEYNIVDVNVSNRKIEVVNDVGVCVWVSAKWFDCN